MQNIKVTIIQSNLIWESKAENFVNFETKIKETNLLGDLVVLPEMFNTGFSMNPAKFAEKPNGTTFNWMKTISAIYNISLAGSYMVVDNNKYYNRFIVMHADGSYRQYDKRHLFRMGNENKVFDAGNNELIFEIKGWKIKALICYDLRFPVFAKNNYIDQKYDYDALIYVANWPKVRDRIWQNLLTARAIENQSYVIAVNRIGKDGNGLDHAGSSCIINPRGEYIIKPQTDIEIADTALISMKDLEEFRSKFTVGLDWDKFEIQ